MTVCVCVLQEKLPAARKGVGGAASHGLIGSITASLFWPGEKLRAEGGAAGGQGSGPAAPAGWLPAAEVRRLRPGDSLTVEAEVGSEWGIVDGEARRRAAVARGAAPHTYDSGGLSIEFDDLSQESWQSVAGTHARFPLIKS
eukprot:SAG22_NODE_10962_length_507_cov_1.267157_1_plen_141_part_10